MGEDFPQSLIDILETKEKYYNINRNVLWKKVMEAQTKKRWLGSWKQKVNDVHGKNSYMKRRSSRRVRRQEGCRRATTKIEKKVRTLKKLIPNGHGDSSMGLDGLFKETAEYILSLQMRVRLMQTMVNALSSSTPAPCN